MITQLSIRNFKSWLDSGDVKLAPITVFFGANSTGKSSLMQLLRIAQRTTQSTSLAPLALADEEVPGNLLHGDASAGELAYRIWWTADDPVAGNGASQSRVETCFETTLAVQSGQLQVLAMAYSQGAGDLGIKLGLQRRGDQTHYRLVHEGITVRRNDVPGVQDLPPPPAGYRFPSELHTLYDGPERYAYLPLQFEKALRLVHYLGPLREAARSTYAWSGDRPLNVGSRGEGAIAALASTPTSRAVPVAELLARLGLVHAFRLHPLAERTLQVLVRTSLNGPEVLISEVGFGVAQVLPVLVQCHFVSEGSTLIFEHPEAHLHPSAQAGLADAFIDVMRNRHLQLIIESHSEHFLHRLQLRIAQGHLRPDETALYFAEMGSAGSSRLKPLDVDPYGNIANWPNGFFGNMEQDLIEMTQAGIERRLKAPA